MTAANGNRAASATWLAGSTFTALAVPLALFGAQPLDISLGGVTLRGKFDDYAMQYLGAAAVVSLGLGAYRLTGTDNAAAPEQPQTLALALSPSPTEGLPKLGSSALTEASLKASGLQAFLDEDDSPLIIRPAMKVDASSTASVSETQPPHRAVSEISRPEVSEAYPQSVVHQPTGQPFTQQTPHLDSLPSGEKTLANIVSEVQAVVQQISLQSQEGTLRASVASTGGNTDMVNHRVTTNGADAPHGGAQVGSLPLVHQPNQAPILPSAQSYVSFARPQRTAASSTARDLQAEMAMLEQVYEIRERMQSLINQVDIIQVNLEQTVYPTQRLVPLRAAQTPTYTISAVEPIRPNQVNLPSYGQIAS